MPVLTELVDVLRNFKTTWAQVGLPDEERQALVHAIYDSIIVRGKEFVGVRLTPIAEGHGFTLALPEQVEWVLARPIGSARML